MKKILLISALAGLFAGTAMAGDVSWSGPYAGVSANVNSDGTRDAMYGVLGGYRFDLGGIVVGAEGSIAREINSSGTHRGAVEANLGYSVGSFLPYASVGHVWTNVGDVNGNTYGIGLDYQLTPANTIGVKVTRDDFGTNPTNVTVQYAFRF